MLRFPCYQDQLRQTGLKTSSPARGIGSKRQIKMENQKTYTLEEVRAFMIEIVSNTIWSYDDHARGFKFADDTAEHDVDIFIARKDLK